MTPTRSVGRAPYISKALKTVAPPHCSGATYSLGMESGVLKRKASRQTAWEANEPAERLPVPYRMREGQKVSWPVRHWWQWPQVEWM